MNRTLKGAIEYWDFLKDRKFQGYGDISIIFNFYHEYIQFLKQLLQLWMFIPCDKEGKPLEKPNLQAGFMPDEMEKIIEEYQQACDRCLFKGFDVKYKNKDKIEFAVGNNFVNVCFVQLNGIKWKYKTISDLANKVEVTDRVAKQFKY